MTDINIVWIAFGLLQKQSKLSRRRGFTLLEVLIAIVILATVLSTVFASYTATFRIVDETESQAEIYQMARIALERIVEDLESALCSPGKAEESEDKDQLFEFAGEDDEISGRSADTLRFSSRAHIEFGDEDQRCGIAEISYYVDEDEEEGFVLYRSDRLQLEDAPEEGKGGLPLCERLSSVDFTYYDAEGEEYDSWDPSSEDGMPHRVSISLQFANPANPETPLKFFTSVALPASKLKDKKE
ncbi:MAG: prepilin-type N-terminal cleavage/methylation domain-containing protein [Desulfobacteraceae bacterium]|nr:prepilin-type N-terminal cleavage/methylation domain-containing protein [Desulfobacteraceae bacterium]